MAEKKCPTTFGGVAFEIPKTPGAVIASFGNPLEDVAKLPGELAKLAEIDLGSLASQASGAISSAGEKAKKAAINAAKDAKKAVQDAAAEEFEKWTDLVGEAEQAAQAVYDGLMNPGEIFGGFADAAECLVGGAAGSAMAEFKKVTGIFSGDDNGVSAKVEAALREAEERNNATRATVAGQKNIKNMC